MRFYGLALAMSAFVLGACGGGDDAATTDTATAAAPGAVAPAAGAPAAGAVAAAPVTGTVHEVKMVGDAQGFRFEPANLTVKQGDGVKFVMVSGGPHNVAFENVTDATAKAQLDANIPAAEKMSELQTRYYQNAGEEVTISFGNVAPGAYNIVCIPHAAMNMRGVITVEQ
jgi:plastocyanin